MKTGYQKCFINCSIILMLTWALSCSGRSGNTSDRASQSNKNISEEVSSKLIKIISPQENTGFKLNEPVKVVLGLDNKAVIPDSVTIYFNGMYISSIKSGPWEYSILPEFTSTTGRKSLKVTAYREENCE
jgi:hypothetical protein